MGNKAKIFAALANLALLLTIYCAFQVQRDGMQLWWALSLGMGAFATVRMTITAAVLHALETLDTAAREARR